MRIDPADESRTVSTPAVEIAGTAEGNPTGLIMVGVVGLAVVPAVVASPVDEEVIATKVAERVVDRTRNDTDDPPLIPDGGTNQTTVVGV